MMQPQMPNPGMAQPNSGTQPDPNAAPGGDDLSPDAVQANMKVNPQQKQQLQRIVIAGLKLMFSPQTHHLLLQQLQGPGDLATKIGQGVAGLMGMLVQESQGSLPRNLIIPAATIFVAHVIDFLKKAGQPVPPDVAGAAVQAAVHAVMGAVGVDSNKAAQIGGQGQAQPAPDDSEPDDGSDDTQPGGPDDGPQGDEAEQE